MAGSVTPRSVQDLGDCRGDPQAAVRTEELPHRSEAGRCLPRRGPAVSPGRGPVTICLRFWETLAMTEYQTSQPASSDSAAAQSPLTPTDVPSGIAPTELPEHCSAAWPGAGGGNLIDAIAGISQCAKEFVGEGKPGGGRVVVDNDGHGRCLCDVLVQAEDLVLRQSLVGDRSQEQGRGPRCLRVVDVREHIPRAHGAHTGENGNAVSGVNSCLKDAAPLLPRQIGIVPRWSRALQGSARLPRCTRYQRATAFKSMWSSEPV